MFTTFEDLGISVDVVATSEVSISLTLDPSKLWERALIEQASFSCNPDDLFTHPDELWLEVNIGSVSREC